MPDDIVLELSLRNRITELEFHLSTITTAAEPVGRWLNGEVCFPEPSIYIHRLLNAIGKVRLRGESGREQDV